MRTEPDVLVIGGGAIGICSAYYLAEQGLRVSVVDQGEMASGCSGASAGLIVPSYCIPLAAPGTLSQGLKWMLKPESPFYIKPRFDPALFHWLRQFRKACKLDQMFYGIHVLRDLNYASLELFDHLITSESLLCNYKQYGWLMAYMTARDFKKGLEEARLLQTYGIELKIFNDEKTIKMEPSLSPEISGGIYFPEDAHLDPEKFIKALAKRLKKRGVTVNAKTEVLDFMTSSDSITVVRTSCGDFQPEQIVLATGAWSPGLVKKLSLKLPLQPARGYSISTIRPEACPKIPLYLSEAKIAVTPLEDVLRFAGTMEFAGMDLRMNPRQMGAITRAAKSYLMGIANLNVVETRIGLRPCSPDGLPIIDRFPRYNNLIFATGHGMLGITLAPITGKLVSQIACGKAPDISLESLSLTRFK